MRLLRLSLALASLVTLSALTNAAGPAPVAATKSSADTAPTLEQLVARRVEFLTGYQNENYAATYRDFTARVIVREKEALGSSGEFSAAVARSLFKLTDSHDIVLRSGHFRFGM